jgi:hypothetical protein
MVSKKDLVIAVLVTFCLTATLFLINTTRSQTVGQYDSWLDVNHDGIINMKDLATVARAFGTSGDPTVNVNVTNWPTQQSSESVLVGVLNCTWVNGYGYSLPSAAVEVAGFSRTYLYLRPDSSLQASQGSYTVDVRIAQVYWEGSTANGSFLSYEMPDYTTNHINVEVRNGQPLQPTWQLFDSSSGLDIKGPYLQAMLYCNTTAPSLGWVIMDVFAYLRNE